MNTKQAKPVAKIHIRAVVVAIVSALIYGIIEQIIASIPYDYSNETAYMVINCAIVALPIIMAIIFATNLKKLAGKDADIVGFRNFCVGFLLIGGVIISVIGFIAAVISSIGCSGFSCLGGAAIMFFALLIAKYMIILGILYFVATLFSVNQEHHNKNK